MFTALVCYSRRWSLGVTLWIIVGLLARYLFWILPQKLLLVDNGLICGDLYLVQLDCIGWSEYIFGLERTPAYKTVYFAWMYGQTTFELVTFFPCLLIVVANLWWSWMLLQVNLVDWLKQMVASKRSEEVADPQMEVKPTIRTLKRAILVALRCVDPDAQKRPKMGHVVHMLEADDFPFWNVSISSSLCLMLAFPEWQNLSVYHHVSFYAMLLTST